MASSSYLYSVVPTSPPSQFEAEISRLQSALAASEQLRAQMTRGLEPFAQRYEFLERALGEARDENEALRGRIATLMEELMDGEMECVEETECERCEFPFVGETRQCRECSVNECLCEACCPYSTLHRKYY